MIQSYTLRLYTKLPENLKAAVNELDSLCFRNNYTQTKADHISQDEKFCSDSDIVSYILAFDKDLLIGETRVYKRAVREMILGGIGSVGTHEKNRMAGVATIMMKKAMELLHNEKCDIVYLCCDTYNKKLVAFYERFGFRLLDKPHTYLGKSGKRHTDIDGMIAPIGNTKLFEVILSNKEPLDIGVGNW
jgi:RimJ/RimL family protein N-acetyltransferase